MDSSQSRARRPRADDEGLPPGLLSAPAARALIRLSLYGEVLLFLALAVLLFAIAVLVVVHTTTRLITPPQEQAFAETVTQALNGVLFVVIVIEVLRTIIARFQGQGLRLQPFLVIAIVSTVRHILTVAARLSLADQQETTLILELLANAGVVLLLVAALVMLRRWARLDED